MKFALALLCANATSIVLAVIAGWLALHGQDGWGWFLFGAVALHATGGSDDDGEAKSSNDDTAMAGGR